jgi:hypothetical protein
VAVWCARREAGGNHVGPRIFEPAYSRWLAAIKREGPDLHSTFNLWDRITDVETVRRLLGDGGVTEADIMAEDDLDRGLRWTIERMVDRRPQCG